MKENKIPPIDVKKYGGKQIAILNGRVIAFGRTLEEVIRRAKKNAPKRPLNEIKIFSVPTTLTVTFHT